MWTYHRGSRVATLAGLGAVGQAVDIVRAGSWPYIGQSQAVVGPAGLAASAAGASRPARAMAAAAAASLLDGPPNKPTPVGSPAGTSIPSGSGLSRSDRRPGPPR